MHIIDARCFSGSEIELTNIIMSKMPRDIRLEIARKAKKEVWKIDELLETIKFEIEAREISEATKSSERAPNQGMGISDLKV